MDPASGSNFIHEDKTMKKTLISMTAASLFAAAAGSASAVEQRPYLTLEVAKMAASQEGKKAKMNIAIVTAAATRSARAR
jgi:hypothetical protein